MTAASSAGTTMTRRPATAAAASVSVIVSRSSPGFRACPRSARGCGCGGAPAWSGDSSPRPSVGSPLRETARLCVNAPQDTSGAFDTCPREWALRTGVGVLTFTVRSPVDPQWTQVTTGLPPPIHSRSTSVAGSPDRRRGCALAGPRTALGFRGVASSRNLASADAGPHGPFPEWIRAHRPSAPRTVRPRPATPRSRVACPAESRAGPETIERHTSRTTSSADANDRSTHRVELGSTAARTAGPSPHPLRRNRIAVDGRVDQLAEPFVLRTVRRPRRPWSHCAHVAMPGRRLADQRQSGLGIEWFRTIEESG